jgi:membrane protein
MLTGPPVLSPFHRLRQIRLPPAPRWLREGVWEPLRETVRSWYADSAPRWSAAIAFYTIFSLAPVLIIVIAVAGGLWGDLAVRAAVVGQFRELLGDAGARQVERLIQAALPGGSGRLATVAGVVTLLVGATAVFTTLRNALNAVWGITRDSGGGIWQSVRTQLRTRLLSFALVLCMAFLLAASLVVNAALTGVGLWIRERLPAPVPVLRLIETAVTLTVLWLLFALIFRWLPDASIAWRDVWIGAAATALLFSAGKLGIGFYLGRSGTASAYGVAGSVVLILLWVYYSAMVFLLGAEFTEVYSRRWGSRIRPAGVEVAKPRPEDGFSTPRPKQSSTEDAQLRAEGRDVGPAPARGSGAVRQAARDERDD